MVAGAAGMRVDVFGRVIITYTALPLGHLLLCHGTLTRHARQRSPGYRGHCSGKFRRVGAVDRDCGTVVGSGGVGFDVIGTEVVLFRGV